MYIYIRMILVSSIQYTYTYTYTYVYIYLHTCISIRSWCQLTSLPLKVLCIGNHLDPPSVVFASFLWIWRISIANCHVNFARYDRITLVESGKQAIFGCVHVWLLCSLSASRMFYNSCLCSKGFSWLLCSWWPPGTCPAGPHERLTKESPTTPINVAFHKNGWYEIFSFLDCLVEFPAMRGVYRFLDRGPWHAQMQIYIYT